MIEIEAPDGTIVEFPDGTSRDVMVAAMRKKFGGPQEQPTIADKRVSEAHQAGGPQSYLSEVPRQQVNTYNPMMGGFLAGFDDEIAAGMLAPIEAGKRWLKGEDGASLSDSYGDLQQRFQTDKEDYRRMYPAKALAGEVYGGLGLGGTAGKFGLTTAGMKTASVPARVAAGSAEGAAYGGLVGAGEANPGERTQGAQEGAVWGGLTGGAVTGAGEGVGRLIQRFTSAKVHTPTIEDVARQKNTLYDAAEQAGVRIKAGTMQRLGQSIMAKAGRINEKLRPKTAGIVEDLADMMNREVPLMELDEFRQVINQSMKRAEPQDKRVLMLLKTELDRFSDAMRPGDVTGPRQAIDILKEGRVLHSRLSKAEMIADMFDDIEIDSEKFSQSGQANAIKTKFRQLAKNKKQMRMLAPEEQAAVRDLAMGKSSPRALQWLAKFAPRGVVSTMLSMGGGGLAGGPIVGAGLPLAGHFAARQTDKFAANAARSLQGDMLRGAPLPQLAPPANRLRLATPSASQEAERLRIRTGR